MAYELGYGDDGTDSRRLQIFLNKEYGESLSPDGLFGTLTKRAVVRYQRKTGVAQTGKVDDATFDMLSDAGLVLLSKPIAGAQDGHNWPKRPSRPHQPNSSRTSAMFGRFRFVHAPTSRNPERIRILDNWEEDNIVSIRIPQLDNCLFAAGNSYVVRSQGKIRCHKLAATKMVRLFEEWERAGLHDRILTCAGAFNARLKRGRTNPKPKNLSNHSWGSAIDINNRENNLGHTPPAVGVRGCVREMVEIANELGFFWGGHYRGRKDGMHFELAEL